MQAASIVVAKKAKLHLRRADCIDLPQRCLSEALCAAAKTHTQAYLLGQRAAALT
jgi:hypothetical protein